MQFHLATVSSMASQLGFLSAFTTHATSSKHRSRNLIIIFQYPTPTDQKSRLYLSRDQFLRIVKSQIDTPSKFWCLRISVRFLSFRFLLFPLFWFYAKLSYFFNFYLWQPRPKWVEDTYSLRKLRFRADFKHQKVILFGDGFLNYVSHRSPPWLVKKSSQIASTSFNPAIEVIASYHLFSLTPIQDPVSTSISRDVIIQLLLRAIKLNHELRGDLNVLFSDFDSLDILLYPYTTFYETGRSSLEAEVNMYIDYLLDNITDLPSSFMLKPHPATRLDKFSRFVELLAKSLPSHKLIGISENQSLSMSTLASIPIECIVVFLVEVMRLLPSRITVISCSTASLSVKTLYPQIQVKQAFGYSLVSKYINDEFVRPRLDQEQLLSHYY